MWDVNFEQKLTENIWIFETISRAKAVKEFPDSRASAKKRPSAEKRSRIWLILVNRIWRLPNFFGKLLTCMFGIWEDRVFTIFSSMHLFLPHLFKTLIWDIISIIKFFKSLCKYWWKGKSFVLRNIFSWPWIWAYIERQLQSIMLVIFTSWMCSPKS